MKTPTVHLNGSSRDALIDGYVEASYALAVAITKLEDAAPNAHDYYPQGDGAFAAARDEHRARVQKLHDVLVELHQLRGAVVQ